MATQDLKLAADQSIHGQGRRSLREQPHLNVPAELPQAEQRACGNLGVADGVNRHMSTARGCGHDGGGDCAAGCVDRDFGAERASQLQRPIVDVDGHHPGADRRTDHQRRQPNPTATEDRQPVAVADPSPLYHGPVCSHEPAAQEGRLGEAEIIGKLHQVQICRRDRYELGEAPAAGETGLEVVVTDLSVPRHALLAHAASATERDRDPVADAPLGDLGTDGVHHSCQLMPGDHRKLDVGIEALPGVEIGPAQARRFDPDHDPVARRHRVGNLLDRDRAVEFVIDGCTHPESVAVPSSGREALVDVDDYKGSLTKRPDPGEEALLDRTGEGKASHRARSGHPLALRQ